MDYDTWRLTDFDMERNCELEEAEDKAIADASDALFDDYHQGQGEAIDEIKDTLEASDKWQDLAEDLRKAYWRKGESRADKYERVCKAYESFMADLCNEVAKDQ